jgi:CRP/FNR family transcriptional regulator, cyclic AMP receptor protein
MDLDAWFENIPQGMLGRKVVLIRTGQTIFSQGDECSRLYYINRGLVRVSTISAEGKSAVINILGPGDLVGIESLTGERTHQTTAVAMVGSNLIKMRSATLTRLLHQHLSTAAYFVDYLLKLYIRAEQDLVNYLINTSEKRLARTLLLLNDYSREVDASILETITQDALADIVGTTRSRVNFFMNRFKKNGYIDYDESRLNIKQSLAEVLA